MEFPVKLSLSVKTSFGLRPFDRKRLLELEIAVANNPALIELPDGAKRYISCSTSWIALSIVRL